MTENADIPKLPGHFKVFQRKLILAGIIGLVCPITGVIAGDRLGTISEGVLLIIFLGAIGLGLFCFFSAKRARCPKCKSKMTQQWDEVKHQSTGLFVCPGYGSKWQTDAIYSFGSE